MASEVKTKQQWSKSGLGLTRFLNVGDLVDDEIVDYFIEVLPPETMTAKCVQMGEPYDHIDGKPRYITIEKINGQWTYTGLGFSQAEKHPIEYHI